MRIHRLAPSELDRIAPLRTALWPDSSMEKLASILATRPEYLVLIALEGDQPAGFAEVSVRREDGHGGEIAPAAFLEGIYVDPAHRRKGIARALVGKALDWAQERGIREIASEALVANTASHAFHRALGFAETERVVCFRRRIAASG